jgi:methyl-accepting chemotaxis protein
VVAEITTGAAAQARRVEQVSGAVADMGKVTEQNAAGAEESSTAAAELAARAEELTRIVRSFQLEAAQPAAPLARRGRALPGAAGRRNEERTPRA